MIRYLSLLVAVGFIGLVPSAAEAQRDTSRGQALEIGADFTVGLPDGDPDERRTAIGPRVTVPVTSRNALVFFADAASSRVGDRSWFRTQMFGVNFRRAIYEAGGFTFTGLAGAGVTRHQLFSESFRSVGPGNVPIIVPERLETSHAPLVSFGVGIEQRVTHRFSVHGEVFLVGAEDAAEYRFQTGFNVPLRPYLSAPASSQTPRVATYGSTTLRTGQKIWVTTQDGRETTGKIRTIDNSRIEIDTTIGPVSVARPDIRRIDVPDGLMNGMAFGAGIGAAAFGAFVSVLNDALCETDDCGRIAPALVGGAYGAAIGGAAGALIDSLVDGRRTVFSSGTTLRISLAPSLSRHEAGTTVRVSW